MRVFEPNRKDYFDIYWRENKDKMMKQRLDRRVTVRREIVKFLGEECCVCGFGDTRALQIDHKMGGGMKEMKEMKSEYLFRIYKNMILYPEEFSKKYQLLCANCNWIKRYQNKEMVISKYR